MHTPKRRSASHGSRPFGRTSRTDGLSRWLAERTRRADQSPFARRTRQAVPGCPGEPAQAHRHDLGQTNPRYQTRRRDEPDCADRQGKPPRGPAASWPIEPQRPPRCRVGRNVRLGRTNPEPRLRHARCLYLVPLGLIRLLALRLKILLYFSCCLQGGLFLRSLRLCLFAVLKDQSVAKPVRWKRSRGSAPTLPPGCFSRTNPRTQPSQHLAKRTQGVPSHDFGRTNPSGQSSPCAFAERTQVAAPLLWAKRTQGAAQFWFGLNERTPMHLLTPSS
jgi:hypothetical protein